MTILGQPIAISNFEGTRNIPARSIPQSLNTLKFAFDGTNMTDPALHVELTVDFSPDGVTWASTSPGPTMNPFPVVGALDGGAWLITIDTGKQFIVGNAEGTQYVVGATAPNSTHVVTNKVPLPEYSWESAPFPDGASRQVRGVLVVTGAPLNTTATITATQVIQQAKPA